MSSQQENGYVEPLLANEQNGVTSNSSREISASEIRWKVIIAAIPNIAFTMYLQIQDTSILIFIANQNNTKLLSAIGFGITWTIAFGAGILFGIGAGSNVYESQAFGAKNHIKAGLYLQKSFVVLGLAFGLILVIALLTSPLLLALGFDEEFSTLVGQYYLITLPGMAGYGISLLLMFYLIAQDKFGMGTKILVIVSALHVFWCYLFISVLDLGLVGASLCKSLTNWIMVMFLWFYCRRSSFESWYPWTSKCLEGVLDYAKSIAHHGAVAYLEWIMFEVLTFNISMLKNETIIAGHTSALSYIYLLFGPQFGIVIASSTFMGNAAGAGDVKLTKAYSRNAIIMNAIMGTFFTVTTFLFSYPLARVYTTVEEVDDVLSTVLKIYSIGIFGDFFNNNFNFQLRTLGFEKQLIKWYFTCYYGIGITCSVIFAHLFGWSYWGAWLGVALGFYSLLVAMFNLFKNVDWEQRVSEIHKEMKVKEEEVEGEKNIEMAEIDKFA